MDTWQMIRESTSRTSSIKQALFLFTCVSLLPLAMSSDWFQRLTLFSCLALLFEGLIFISNNNFFINVQIQQVPYNCSNSTHPLCSSKGQKGLKAQGKAVHLNLTSAAKPAHAISVHLFGRLGNNLFQVAAGYGIAQSLHRSFYINYDGPLRNLFPHVKSYVRVGNVKVNRTIVESKGRAYSPNLYNVPAGVNVRLSAYLQSWKYFEKCNSQVRAMFKLNDIFRAKAYNVLLNASVVMLERQRTSNSSKNISTNVKANRTKSYTDPRNFTYIGVHVRIGDMITPHMKSQGYLIAPASYYPKAFKFYRSLYPNPLFIICSDNREWVHKNIHGDDVVVAPTANLEDDFATLASCNHSIMSVGSFGWWASWLAGGKVIYYELQATKGSSIGRMSEITDYALPSWISMGA